MVATRKIVNPLYVGVDVGGTGIKIGVVDNAGVVLDWDRIETHHQRGAEDGVKRIIEVVTQLFDQNALSWDSIRAVGIGTPGTMDIRAGTLLHMPNMPGWSNFPIQSYLAEQTGKPVAFINDATAAAYGEFWTGSGKNVNSIVMLTLGTGVGGGIITQGRWLDGEHSHGSECGHIIIDCRPDARRCPCGQLGHLEAYTSATSVAQRCVEGIQAGVNSSLTEFVGREDELTSLSVFEHSEAGDEFARQVIKDTAGYLAIGITSLMHVLDPDMVVLGGAMDFGGKETESGRMFIEGIRTTVSTVTFPVLAQSTIIDFASLGNACGFIGAAGIARAQHGES